MAMNDWTTTQIRRFIYDACVLNHMDFGHEWKGWRMRGRCLITPDGDRISPERLRGIIQRESWREKLYKGVQVPAGRVVDFPIEPVAKGVR